MVTGQFSEPTFQVPFDPVHVILNDRNHLNLGRHQDRAIVKETGDVDMDWVSITNNEVLEMPAGDSALITMVHHMVEPDAHPSQPDLQLSSTHYWTVGGYFPGGFKMKSRIIYKGGSDDDLDYDLVGDTDSLLILAWRPNAETPWAEYPYYTRVPIGFTQGRINIAELLPGQYAFANGELPLATSAAEYKRDLAVKVFPNPVESELHVQAILPTGPELRVSLRDGLGKTFRSITVSAVDGQLATSLPVADVPAGIYWLEISDPAGEIRMVEKFVKR